MQVWWTNIQSAGLAWRLEVKGITFSTLWSRVNKEESKRLRLDTDFKDTIFWWRDFQSTVWRQKQKFLLVQPSSLFFSSPCCLSQFPLSFYRKLFYIPHSCSCFSKPSRSPLASSPFFFSRPYGFFLSSSLFSPSVAFPFSFFFFPATPAVPSLQPSPRLSPFSSFQNPAL